MPSFYSPDLQAFQPGSRHELGGAENHHLVRVSRHQVGDEIKLNSGKGLMVKARIVEIGKESSTLELLEQIPASAVPDFAIAFALLKSQHDELIVEKCTELGASAFFQLHTEFTIRKASANTNERFVKIALAAIKQCDNPFLPLITPTAKLSEALNLMRQQGYEPVICSENMPDRWMDYLEGKISKPCFLIGPEGGWSTKEKQIFVEQEIIEISISKLICRAETAAITVAAQWIMKRI